MYIEITKRLQLDKTLYKDYILNPNFPMLEMTRDILTMFMIENINYEVDIVANLKYFSQNYHPLIEDYYKNGLSYEKIFKKYSYTKNQIIHMFNIIKINLYDMLKKPQQVRFDFKFYEENRLNPKISFIGDIELIDKIFRLYYGLDLGNRMIISKIITKLGLSYKSSFVQRNIRLYMLAICKFKNGIFKEKNTITKTVEKEFLKYFRNHEKQIYFNRRALKINKIVLNALLEKQDSNYFRIEYAFKDQIKEILRKYLTKGIRNELMAILKISEKEFMSGKEISRVFKILDNLDKSLNIEFPKQLKKINDDV